VLRQHTPAEWINLAKGDGLESARPFEAKRKTANSAEQIE
jgi:hypothetical protein